MLIAAVRTVLDRARQEGGFSLAELLVSMLAGIVVISALFTIVDTTLHATTRTFTKVDATERSRTTLEQIENELHSACVADNVTPIQGGANGSQVSDANNLVFISQYGTAPTPTPVEHKLTFNATNGTLTDYTYAVNGGNAPNWTFSSTPTTTAGTQLLNNVTRSGSTNNTPVFQYFAYEPYTDGSGNTDMMLMDGSSSVPGTTSLPNPDPLTTTSGLSASDASQTAEVLINLVVGGGAAAGERYSGENTNLADTKNTVTDSIVLRFTPAPNESATGATFGPCE
jgi:Tfp pilus assembly protein PilW